MTDDTNAKITETTHLVSDQKQVINHFSDLLLTSENELEDAFKILKRYDRRVTFFGSARTKNDDKYYQLADKLSGALAARGYAILSGGGNGIMEAANRGAFDAHDTSLGFNIHLPHEQALNGYTTQHFTFHYFFTRKVIMTYYAHAYIYFPGGFGTFDEFFEVLTLMQTGKMKRAPLVLVGNEFWGDLQKFIIEHQLKNQLISSGDEQIYTITEDVDAICDLIGSAIN